MTDDLTQIKQDFIGGLSNISGFWGFPKGMGAIFAVLYLSADQLSLDELVARTGLTKGAVSTDVRALARLGLVHSSARLGDRKDYYAAETDFYRAVRAILKERRDRDFDRAVATVHLTLEKLEAGAGRDDPGRGRPELRGPPGGGPAANAQAGKPASSGRVLEARLAG